MLRALAIAALLAAGLLTGAPKASAMSFALTSAPAACRAQPCILATGPIEAGAGRAFDAFLAAHRPGPGALVVLDSPGGDLLESFRLGNSIRAARLSTRVGAFDPAAGAFRTGGDCASACVYAYIGGVERSLSPGARIGVHQVTTVGGDWAMSAPDGLWLMSQVATHVSRLCGHADLLIPALATPPQQMHWLTATELTRYAVVTDAAPARFAAVGTANP